MDNFELYDYVGLEENRCRNSLPQEIGEAPWCYSGGVKTQCGVPKCEGIPPPFGVIMYTVKPVIKTT